MNIKNIFENNRETFQLAYGVALIVLIPLLIATNAVFIIRKYNDSIDLILQKQAVSIGQTVSILMKGDLPWEYFIQYKLESLMAGDLGILELTVLKPEGSNFKIVASTDKEKIGQVSDALFYKKAWLLSEENSLATDSVDQSEINKNQGSGQPDEGRFWLVAVPMKDTNDVKTAILTIRLSSSIVDELTEDNRRISIYLLIGTVIIVMLFLLVVVRLWDYALLYKKGREIDKMKDEFISMASHELRAPVTGIRGYTAMMLDGSLGAVSDKAKKYLKMIKSAADRLSVLVEDLLDVGRIEQGRISLFPIPTDAAEIIRETVEEFQLSAGQKNLELKYLPHQDPLPDIRIDRGRFKQILINLVNNSIKYTIKGGVEIITREKYDGRVLEIVVRDTGIGMSDKDRERLFEKFYRIRNDYTKNVTGTGLGMWITKELVELMHGTIAVESIESAGTRVTLQFPIINKDRE